MEEGPENSGDLVSSYPSDRPTYAENRMVRHLLNMEVYSSTFHFGLILPRLFLL